MANKIKKALEQAKKHDDAAKANGWQDNETTDRLAQEYLATRASMTDEERKMLDRLL